MDREKVIKGLECCITFDKTFECGTDCPYLPTCDAEVEPIDAPKCAGLQLHIDALELLKEQEAVKPKRKVRHGETCQYQHWCGNCMVMLHGKPKFCPNCGRKVKWDG